jgi:hypothetical protein
VRIARFFSILLSLAVSGCGGCVNAGDANGAGANANANSGSTPSTQGPGTGGGKIIQRVTTIPPALRVIQTATLQDGG